MILVSSIWNLSMVQKTSWFCDGKTFNFLIKQVSKLDILKSERYFQFFLGYNLWYIQARKLEFSIYVLYSKYYTKIKNQTVIGKFKTLKLYHKFGKKRKFFILRAFFTDLSEITFDKHLLLIWNVLQKLYAENTMANWRIK